ncbi:MAG: hypothetical protein CM1200mP22_28400 [Dehalococcoidia bacterium]|nr:MAG: hypothetical protein CM1200mP22_28400 [Dehalococcoidia bacterium]
MVKIQRLQNHLEYLAYACQLVLEETDLLPHANPGTMARREIDSLKPFNPSMGLMLESTSDVLWAEGGPHEFAPANGLGFAYGL